MMSLEKIIEIERKIPGKKDEYRQLSELPNPFYDRKDIPLYLCDMAISNFLVDYQGYLNPCHKCRIKKWNLLVDDFKTAWDDYQSLLKEKASVDNKCLKCQYLVKTATHRRCGKVLTNIPTEMDKSSSTKEAISEYRNSDFQFSGSAISSRKNIQDP